MNTRAATFEAMNWAQPGQGASSGQGAPSDGWSTPPTRYDERQVSDGFGGGGQIEIVTPNKPPMLWLGIGLVLIVAAFIVALIGQTATTGLIGWVLAGPLAIGAMAMFVTADAKRRESGWYAPSDLAEWGRRILIIAALVAVALCAWFIANDVARGMWR